MNDGGDCRTAPATPGLLITNMGFSDPVFLKYTQHLSKDEIKFILFVYYGYAQCYFY